MSAVYNEYDPHKAEWLRAAIAAGVLPPGDVDTRSIEDIHPDDYRKYRQVHLFAGVGLWAYAAARAGWDDRTPFWSCSCPCQPFSAAGKGNGFADERHLWPAVFHLIGALRPERIVGEQVASRDGREWLELVHGDVDAAEYALRVANLSSPIVGSPNIRQRLYWVADAHDALGRSDGPGGHEQHGADAGWTQGAGDAQGRGELGLMENPGCTECGTGRSEPARPSCGWAHGEPTGPSVGSSVANPDGNRCSSGFRGRSERAECDLEHGRGPDELGDPNQTRLEGRVVHPERRDECAPRSSSLDDRGLGTGPTSGYWRDADWILCADPDGAKWRPVESLAFPLAAGLPRSFGAMPPELRRLAEVAGLDARSLARAKAYRTGALKGWGDAINAELAIAFLRSIDP